MAAYRVSHFRRRPVADAVFLVTVVPAILGFVGCGAVPPSDSSAPDVFQAPATRRRPTEPDPPSTTSPPPPAISGGTLLVTRDDATVVAADSDRDSVWLVDAEKQIVRARVRLATGAEPGRVVEDQDGKIHVALRRGGQVVKIDPASGEILSTRNVCAAPRGLAYDAMNDNLYVACAGGELVTMQARGGDTPRSVFVERDLRDVVVQGNRLLISRFRSAELLTVDEAGTILSRVSPRTLMEVNLPMGPTTSASPSTAWRMVALPGQAALMLHQRSDDGAVTITRPGGYGGSIPCKCPCSSTSIVTSGLTTFSPSTSGTAIAGAGAILPGLAMVVDVAVTREGDKIAVLSPSSGKIAQDFKEGISRIAFGVTVIATSGLNGMDACSARQQQWGLIDAPTELVAGAFDGKTRLWLQSRDPAQLQLLPTASSQATPISLTGAEDRHHDGHELFHVATGAGLACASCHAEAGDDGHVWNFEKLGLRRTPSLRGGLLATAPFHWDGDMNDMSQLMNDVFTGRMSGPHVYPSEVQSIGAWLDAQPGLPKSAPRDAQAVSRGQALFESAELGCQSCHSGALFTNNATVDVGTGKAFQVPALRELVTRAPYLHNGCANTLRARFDSTCGGGEQHGHTAHLSSDALDDLIAYLETL